MKRDAYGHTWQTGNSRLTQTDQGLQRLFTGTDQYHRTGVGWHHQGHDLLGGRGGKDWVLDPNRTWKTKWKTTRAQPGSYGRAAGHQVGVELGWMNPWHNRIGAGNTDRGYYTTRYWHTGTTPGAGYNKRGNVQHALEVLDWDAYDRDSLYGAWLTHAGKDKFNTLEQFFG